MTGTSASCGAILDPRRAARSSRRSVVSLCSAVFLGSALLCVVGITAIEGSPASPAPTGVFELQASFDVSTNGSTFAGELALVQAATLLAYTDEPGRRVGLVDITDPIQPRAAGGVEVAGIPKDIAAHADRLFVSVDASLPDRGTSTGALVLIDSSTRRIAATIDLRGQPEGLAVSPDGRFVVVAVENRAGPSDLAGRVVVINVEGQPAGWTMRDVVLTPEDSIAGSPRPVGVAVSEHNIAAITLQDNNAMAFVDLEAAEMVRLVDAGSVRLDAIDATEEEIGPQGHALISLSESVTRRREPGGVAWLDAGSVVVVNEGSDPDPAGAEGGGRGFSVLSDRGVSRFESGSSLEHAAISVGHFDPERAANRGVEPESVAVGVIDGQRHMVITAEHANVAAVYLAAHVDKPRLVQMLPTGNRPADVVIEPDKGLIVISASEPHDAGEYPALLTIYRHQPGGSGPIQLASAADAGGLPIPWLALSGLAADPDDGDTMYAVSDASLAEAAIYRLDIGVDPAVIVDRQVVTNADGTVPTDLDLEGIAVDVDSMTWLISEGRSSFGSERVPRVLQVDQQGVIRRSISFPLQLAMSAEGIDAGLEGVAVLPGAVYVVQQRPWTSDVTAFVRMWRFDLTTQVWTVSGYPLDAAPSTTSWVGASDLSAMPDGRLAILERDNMAGPAAVIKRVYAVDVASASFVEPASPVVPVLGSKTLVADLLGALQIGTVWAPNKPEGLAFDALGRVVVVTDNDGLDDAVGQTMLVRL